jgi:hypothetical protein
MCIVISDTNVEKYPKNPMKTVSFPELDQLFWAEYKKRQSLSRKESKAKVLNRTNHRKPNFPQNFIGK